jgi:membrane peptidoglycan carboxypeptidase
VLNRRNTVLARMAELGTSRRRQHAKAKKAKVVTKPSRTPSGCANATIGGYFCDYVTKVFLADERFGKTREGPREPAVPRRGHDPHDPGPEDAAAGDKALQIT